MRPCRQSAGPPFVVAELRADWVKGVKSEKRLIQGLLIIRQIDMALKTSVDLGFPSDAFDILTLLHKYDEAMEFALEQADSGDPQGGIK